ncbi:hypothetical protein OS493_011249 [Desmophyllum pertusum]|uniref:Uncharacterized protein n=1 Tax=Desmophyllum pertusum TaxID=174260 RepID=A0A9W9Z258_9CNID|nr:hypothetical protein OS493_011249 [Desmophyllum pertusum]
MAQSTFSKTSTLCFLCKTGLEMIAGKRGKKFESEPEVNIIQRTVCLYYFHENEQRFGKKCGAHTAKVTKIKQFQQSYANQPYFARVILFQTFVTAKKFIQDCSKIVVLHF